MEKELISARTKAENYRQCHSKDNMELKKKIIELENIVSIFYTSKIHLIIKIDIDIISDFRSKRRKK